MGHFLEPPRPRVCRGSAYLHSFSNRFAFARAEDQRDRDFIALVIQVQSDRDPVPLRLLGPVVVLFFVTGLGFFIILSGFFIIPVVFFFVTHHFSDWGVSGCGDPVRVRGRERIGILIPVPQLHKFIRVREVGKRAMYVY